MEVKHQPRKRNRKGDHLWSGCGSEAGQNERKPTVEPSTGSRKEDMGNQVGEKVETEEARAERAHRISHCEAETGRKRKGRNRG